MAELVEDCPRCGAKQITFDVNPAYTLFIEYQWKQTYEAFSRCRHCLRSTIFTLENRVDVNCEDFHKSFPDRAAALTDLSLNRFVRVSGYVGIKDHVTLKPPSHLPEAIEPVFKEAATCLSVGS
ncbi:MAG TPA: hypothetical protein VF219_06660 [Vicinamibacterales bacterium]